MSSAGTVTGRSQGIGVRRLLPALLGLLLVLAAASTSADGVRGSAGDQLDWPGSATDRYLDDDEVTIVLHAAAAKIATCTSDEAQVLNSAEPVWLVFGVGPQGRAVAAATRRQGAATAVEQCLLSVLNELEFGDHDGLPGSYSYPVVFDTTGEVRRHLPYPLVITQKRPLRLPLLSLPLDLSAEELERIEASLGAGR